MYVNAVAHKVYATMYEYLTAPSAKKPLAELDQAPYFSAKHPQGDELKSLLHKGRLSLSGHAGRAKKGAKKEDQKGEAKPPRKTLFAAAFEWVVGKGLRGKEGTKQFQADAVKQFEKGNGQLLEFSNRHQRDLIDQLNFIWKMTSAASQVSRMKLSRPHILLDWAGGKMGACANQSDDARCSAFYEGILRIQGVESTQFRHTLFTVLDLGRKTGDKAHKGNAIMLVGGHDSGKTTITTPLRLIFESMGTPPASSTAPLLNCRGHELFLWQDFRYAPGKPGRKEDVGLQLDEGSFNRILEGEP